MGYQRSRSSGYVAQAIDEPQARRDVRRHIRALLANFGRRSNPELELGWLDKLEELDGAKLSAAFNEALTEPRFPTLARVLEIYRGRRDTEQWKPPPPLTQQQQQRSDHAAIMSMLWLRYNHGHDALGLETMKRLFPGDVNKALAAAQEIYPRAVVNKWMEDQERAGN